ncbi:hypothetical protein JCM24511_01089 [Saitozyma sp. JCM 24511]|nr:hypothetical protein JCM24511_01089 [Saitozyma sp. JCM 24511]
MGNAPSSQGQYRQTNHGRYDGPLFGGHYPGDFSLKRRPDVNKPLPAVPQSKSVRFGPSPPAWEFYRDAPSCDNTANTRYCSPASAPGSYGQTTPPPPYGYGYGQVYEADRGPLWVWNR